MAIPKNDRLIIVLRVDADAVMHPVLVGGKVLYRVPGANVPADRQRLIDLLVRDRTSSRDAGIAGHSLANPADFPLWDGDEGSVATVRVAGGRKLPHRIIYRPWLTSTVRVSALTALRDSPLPERCWGLASHLAGVSLPTDWRVTEARSRTLKLHSPFPGDILNSPNTVLTGGDVPVQGSVFIQLAGRVLSVVVGLRWFPRESPPAPRMAIDDLYSALLAGLVTVSSTCTAITLALDAAEPADLTPWEAWLQPRQELRTSDVLDTSAFPKDGESQPQGGYFERTRTMSNTFAQLDQLARDWVMVLLLDMGIRDFETSLRDLPRPGWATSA